MLDLGLEPRLKVRLSDWIIGTVRDRVRKWISFRVIVLGNSLCRYCL